MTAPDLDALAALLDKAEPKPWEFGGATWRALSELLAYVRELERARDQATLNRACADALVSAAQDMTSAAALAMRERCAQRAESAQANGADCAAAIRALET